ncbi:MAG TPA: hypothetical protein DFM08_10970 [Pseudomonas sp.]|nr:hypothetical protein [Pseudomonas sp.]
MLNEDLGEVARPVIPVRYLFEQLQGLASKRKKPRRHQPNGAFSLACASCLRQRRAVSVM